VAHNIDISDELILEKAKELGKKLGVPDDFKYSRGWLANVKKRQGIKSRFKHGEAGSVDQTYLAEGRARLKTALELVHPDDLFNMDETALFYKTPPNKTLCTNAVKGQKMAKDRITVALCANASGTVKLQPFIIGKSKNPRAFKGFEWQKMVSYSSNKKAWMTGVLFENWAREFDRRMRSQNRKVHLLLDNHSSHVSTFDPPLSHTTIVFLPPNTTSELQPLDMGIIHSFKAHYKKLLVKKMLNDLDTSNNIAPTTMREAVYHTRLAWDSVTEKTIRNCWRRSGLKMMPTIPAWNFGEAEDDGSPADQRRDENSSEQELADLLNDFGEATEVKFQSFFYSICILVANSDSDRICES
jgi:hypothetical protein